MHSYFCDLADTDAIAATARKILQEVGHPTILVNNAGVVQGKLLLDLSAEEVRQYAPPPSRLWETDLHTQGLST